MVVADGREHRVHEDTRGERRALAFALLGLAAGRKELRAILEDNHAPGDPDLRRSKPYPGAWRMVATMVFKRSWNRGVAIVPAGTSLARERSTEAPALTMGGVEGAFVVTVFTGGFELGLGAPAHAPTKTASAIGTRSFTVRTASQPYARSRSCARSSPVRTSGPTGTMRCGFTVVWLQ